MGVDSATPKGRLLTDYFIPLTPTKKILAGFDKKKLRFDIVF